MLFVKKHCWQKKLMFALTLFLKRFLWRLNALISS